MNKVLGLIVLVLIFLVGGFFLLNNYIYEQKQGDGLSLTSKTWEWEHTLINDGRRITPAKAGAFKVTFGEDGRFTATTDCNQMGGSYKAEDGRLEISDMFSTKMYCEGSQESTFAQFVGDSTQYHFTDDGKLILGIKFDSGTVTFR